ncbi:biliverdin-producing heme oxygenase [Roseomonas marmotae]|uniref:Biliverdin-producing heme oxygenase n=1 Tax=Roseomonas marmotae TaxID=2768161 RepID=A0ABS3K6S7_9PROT|nr:biliverdin-producing heme oxygenase [Roseomonas marmotae]MBO1073162.1 biliverdin-producing heme oxygenase [Roseomonas marmotae]QTI79203.1 biliverdin-producing heme oxygenase [Roseomonas marmotae]
MRDVSGQLQQGIRWHLRQSTEEQHAGVDMLGSRFPLETPAGYRRFLRAHARALPALEQALEEAGIAGLLPDWPRRSRRAALAADLAALGVEPPPPLPFGPPASAAAALGAAYVLEGSRFGNGMLLRQVNKAAGPSKPAATAYLGHQVAGEGNAWLAFLVRLEDRLADPALWPQATEGARDAFRCFHAALAAEQAEDTPLHA